MPSTASAMPDLRRPPSSSASRKRDRRLRALEAEALLADVARREEALEGLGGVEALEDVALLVRRERRRHAFDVGLDPALLLRVLDVHVLDPDGPAVGVAEDAEDLAERQHVAPAEAAGDETPVEVPDRQAVGERVELGAERAGVGLERVEAAR